MEPVFILKGVLIVLAQIFSGLLVLRWLCGIAASSVRRFATALILGPAILCLEMLLLGASFGAYSYPLVVIPWVVGGLVWTGRACVRGTLHLRPVHLFGCLGALLIIAGASTLAVPPTQGDPANNFAGFARLYAYIGHIDPVAAQELSVGGHFEYPPLVPAVESLFFLIDHEAGANLLAPLFPIYLLALLTLAWTVLAESASRLERIFYAGLLTLLAVQPTTAQLFIHGYADLPLIAALLWMLSELRLLLESSGEERKDFSGLLLAGLTLALTKHEGIVLSVSIAAVIPILRGWRFLWIPLGMTTIASLWPLWIAQLELSSTQVFGVVGGSFLDKVSRIPHVIEALGSSVFSYHRYPVWGFASFSIVAGLVILVRAIGWQSPTGMRLALVGFALHFSLYVIAFSVTGEDIEWHLRTAGDRLAFHLVPYFLLAIAGSSAPLSSSSR